MASSKGEKSASQSPRRRSTAAPVEDPLRLKKRREPRQLRSRSTVENIKQAALMLAAEKGFRRLTTEEIAERAGVNIGSLYQYFPNRQAILLSIYEDVSSQVLEKMKNLNLDDFYAPLDKAVRRSMEQLLSIFKQHQLVLLEMMAEMPELNEVARTSSYVNLSRGGIRTFVQYRMDHAQRREINCRAFFIEHIAFGCISQFLRDNRDGLSSKEFLDDLAWLLTVYIDKPSARSQRKPAPVRDALNKPPG